MRAAPVSAPRSAANVGLPAEGPRRRVDSRELLGPGRELEIVHGSACYRLRLTSLGKLILTK